MITWGSEEQSDQLRVSFTKRHFEEFREVMVGLDSRLRTYARSTCKKG